MFSFSCVKKFCRKAAKQRYRIPPRFGSQRVESNCLVTYLEQGTLLFPVPATVAGIFGNGNNLDGTRVSRRLSPRHPPRTPRIRRIACPSAPDNPDKQNNALNFPLSSRILLRFQKYPRDATHLGAVVGTLTCEEATLRQTGVTLGTLEAPYVKVLVLHPQYLPTALLLAGLTKRFT